MEAAAWAAEPCYRGSEDEESESGEEIESEEEEDDDGDVVGEDGARGLGNDPGLQMEIVSDAATGNNGR